MKAENRDGQSILGVFDSVSQFDDPLLSPKESKVLEVEGSFVLISGSKREREQMNERGC